MRGNRHTHRSSMAPQRIPASSTRYERNHDIALLSDLGKSYEQIARDLGVAPSTVRGVVKRYRARGHVQEAGRSGRPSKITPDILQQVENAVQENPRASLDEIVEGLQDLEIGRTTVNKVTKQLGFQLRIPRKKPFLTPFAKIRRKFWCRKRRHWAIAKWRQGIWLDEAKMQYVAYQPGRKVRIRSGEELEERNLAPSFKSGSVGVGFWAAIAYGRRTPLIRTRKRTPAERTTPRDRLGTNASQYANEIYEPYLVPFLLSLDLPIEKVLVMDDNVGYHRAGLNKVITSAFQIPKEPLPAFSPDLNPIENVWHILKSRLRKRFTKGEHRPHSEDELWEALSEEWEAIDQGTIDRLIDSMPSRLADVIKAEGSHTKW